MTFVGVPLLAVGVDRRTVQALDSGVLDVTLQPRIHPEIGVVATVGGQSPVLQVRERQRPGIVIPLRFTGDNGPAGKSAVGLVMFEDLGRFPAEKPPVGDAPMVGGLYAVSLPPRICETCSTFGTDRTPSLRFQIVWANRSHSPLDSVEPK